MYLPSIVVGDCFVFVKNVFICSADRHFAAESLITLSELEQARERALDSSMAT